MEDIPIYGSILLVAGLAHEDITKVLDAKSLDETSLQLDKSGRRLTRSLTRSAGASKMSNAVKAGG